MLTGDVFDIYVFVLEAAARRTIRSNPGLGAEALLHAYERTLDAMKALHGPQEPVDEAEYDRLIAKADAVTTEFWNSVGALWSNDPAS